jgi:hypothetical protein
MSSWDLEDYRQNSPFITDYPKTHGGKNFQYGYTSLPSYAGTPMPVYEQQYRNEQAKIPSRILCGCGEVAPMDDSNCKKCGQNFGNFVGNRDTTYDIAYKKINKERLTNLNDFTNQDNLFIILVFIFMIFMSCIYVHISTLRTELDALKHSIYMNKGTNI